MLNNVIIMGRLTADPELKQTPNGIYVTSFTIAVDRLGSKDKATDFIRVEAWRQAAEFVCRYFVKGKAIGVDGQIHVDQYDKNGEKRSSFKVVADRIFFVGDKAADANVAPAALPKPEVNEAYNGDDDLPF